MNRELQPRIEARIEWAEAALTAGMGVYGLTAMRVGAFEVERTETGVVIRKLAAIDAEQLELPEARDGVSPDDGLEDPELLEVVADLREMVQDGGGGV